MMNTAAVRQMLAGAALTLAAAACGHDATEASDRTFDALDSNHDGVLDPAESNSMPKLAAKFVDADTNHDGSLDKQEFARMLAQLDQGTSGQG
jgi:Ca2+-binding EF-hand superfamily protein